MAANATLLSEVRQFIEALGYTFQPTDTWLIGYCCERAEEEIKNACNTASIPDGLMKVAVQITAGEFLFAKKESGQLAGFNLNFEFAVKQIQEGDTNIAFAVEQTPEKRLDALIGMLFGGRRQFVSYRRLAW